MLKEDQSQSNGKVLVQCNTFSDSALLCIECEIESFHEGSLAVELNAGQGIIEEDYFSSCAFTGLEQIQTSHVPNLLDTLEVARLDSFLVGAIVTSQSGQ